ncbi:Yip1 family protein [Pseudoruegeria sp. HB172150]|uniref:Yip1 family protein n=1 Tax=Pseudoruegeria sp. HB172150 TaxID=2721164 RepID=UPI001552D451|nr:Yip1 family protein [Pseudoruegeria sp. HB172150]
MTLDLKTLIGQAWATFAQPREAARWIMELGLPRRSRWEALLLVVVLSVALQYMSVRYLGDPGLVMFGEILNRPFTSAIIQACSLLVAIFAIFWIGRAMGGTGRFADAIILVVWLQFCIFLLSVAQTLALVVLPPVAVIISLASIVAFFWLLTNFVAELHGFTSLGKVFGMIIVSIIALTFCFAIILNLIGFSVGVPANV